MASSFSRRSYVPSSCSLVGAPTSSKRMSRFSGVSVRMSTARAGSVCGGAGGSGICISKASHSMRGFSTSRSAESSIIGNEKITMQSLNNRLASYLDKVHSLEKANADLELKIHQFLEGMFAFGSSSTGIHPGNNGYEQFHEAIMKAIFHLCETEIKHRNTKEVLNYFEKLYGRNMLRAVGSNIVKIKGVLQGTNISKKDFRDKSVESNIAVLKRVLEDLNISRNDLSMQITELKEERAILNKNHEEDLMAARAQMRGQVQVEVNAAPQQDLTKVLAEMREHYEGVTAKNQRDLENWFKTKTEALKQEVVTSTTDLKSSRSEVNSVRSKLQFLEIELQSLLALKANLEGTLSDTKCHYSTKLSGYQNQVCVLEDQLVQLCADLECQSQEYQMLLDIKTRLEMEIAEYRRLLDGEAMVKSTSKHI